METVYLTFSCKALTLPLAENLLLQHGFENVVLDAAKPIMAVCDQLVDEKVDANASFLSGCCVVSLSSGTPDALDRTRKWILEKYEPAIEKSMPLDASMLADSTMFLTTPKALKPHVKESLEHLADFCKVGMVVSEDTNGALVLHLYGPRSAVEYAHYKSLVLMNHLYGYAVLRIGCPLSVHPLVSGPDRQNLHTLFQQTGVNVYMPPQLGPYISLKSGSAALDEVYLCGDAPQVVIARKIFNDVLVDKIEMLTKECTVSISVADEIRRWHREAVEEIMVRYAVFINLYEYGSSRIGVLGSSRHSIERAIDAVMSLCGDVYSAVVDISVDVPAKEMEVALKNVAGVTRCTLTRNNKSSLLSLIGSHSGVKSGVETIATMRGVTAKRVRYSLEVGTSLKEFVVGKKHGKIAKIIAPTSTKVRLDPLHDCNFCLTLEGSKFKDVQTALELLEGELPAEKWMYIPEAYHRQVIGSGGQSIQSLMRKYNVYMRFCNCAGERYRYPNAFGNLRVDNVLIRCPAKNAVNIDAAADDLLATVQTMTSKHQKVFIRVTRNHRRALLAHNSNVVLEIENATHAAIKFPDHETKETQIMEISALTQDAAHDAATKLKAQLPQSDFEFRVPWTPRFVDVVGPRSDFAVKVSAPLFTLFGSQVQAFDRVQIQGDGGVYSQIVVTSLNPDDRESVESVSRIVTAYLRENGLDIVDKGTLKSDLVVGSTPAQAPRLRSTPFGSNANNLATIKLNYNETPIRKRPGVMP